MENIITNRLKLTLVTMSDSAFMSDLFTYADVRKYYVLRDDHAQNIRLFTQYIVDTGNRQQSINYIIRLTTGTPIGFIGAELNRESSGEISWNTSYAVHPLYRKRGYASEALIAFTNHLKQFSIAKSFLDISDDNEASKKVAIKAGYKYNKDTAHFDPKHMELSLLFHWEKMLCSMRDKYFSMACAAYRNKEYRTAENLFLEALQQPYENGSPNTDALCYSNMGMACSSYQNYQDAFRYLKKAQALGLTNPSIERELLWLRNNVGLF